MKKYSIAISLLLIGGIAGSLFAGDNFITVYYNRDIGNINKRVFGSNILVIDNEKHNHTDYGNGIWNPKAMKSVSEVIELAKTAGLSVVRIHTGRSYDWKIMIGGERKHFLYGLDEYLTTMDEIKAEPVMIISYFTGSPQDAANLVEYLNARCTEKKDSWACKRAENGHPAPYGVKYFEFGNEMYVYWSKKHNYKVTPEEYASRYIAYQEAMKRVDPTIKLGLNLHQHKKQWDYAVLTVAGDKADFVIKHLYPPKDLGYYRVGMHYDNKEMFEVILGSLSFHTEKQFASSLKLFKDITGRDNINVAITEFNLGVPGNKPPYRHSLGAALVNAEILRILSKPEYKILMANYWEYANGTWGMIRADSNYMKHDYKSPITYTKRPSFYVYELYSNYFGDELIATDVNSSVYDISKYKKYMKAILRKKRNEAGFKGKIYKAIDKYVPFMKAPDQRKVDEEVTHMNFLREEWKIERHPGVTAEEKEGILKIEPNDSVALKYLHAVKYADVKPNTYYRLSGLVRTENVPNNKGVLVEIVDGKRRLKILPRRNADEVVGDDGWQDIDVNYKTMPDTHSITVRVGMTGNKAILASRAFFQNFRLEEFVLPDTLIPHLSVNASKSGKDGKVYLMVVNKNMNNSITSWIHLEDVVPSTRADLRILNGPSVDANNEYVPDNVKVKHSEFEIKSNPFEFTFEPHSLTSIEITVSQDYTE